MSAVIGKGRVHPSEIARRRSLRPKAKALGLTVDQYLYRSAPRTITVRVPLPPAGAHAPPGVGRFSPRAVGVSGWPISLPSSSLFEGAIRLTWVQSFWRPVGRGKALFTQSETRLSEVG